MPDSSGAEVVVRRERSGGADDGPRAPAAEGDRLRQDLLESAANLMATHGDVDSISLRAVARDAGVSATAVYRHFDDHLTLLREASEYCWANFRRRPRRCPAVVGRPVHLVPRPWRGLRAVRRRSSRAYRVLFSNKLDLGDQPSAVGRSAFQLLVDDVTTILALLDDDRDPHFVAAQVHTWIHGIVDLRNTHPDVPWPATTDLLDGLGVALRLHPRG